MLIENSRTPDGTSVITTSADNHIKTHILYEALSRDFIPEVI